MQKSQNQRLMEREMLPDCRRPVNSSEFRFTNEGVSLVSYVPKRSKAVVLLSTQHRDAKVASDDKAKPEITVVTTQPRAALTCWTSSSARIRVNDLQKVGLFDYSEMCWTSRCTML